VDRYEISVEASFRADHAIRLADGSPEASHGHLWKAAATFRARKLDEPMGVVINFVEVRRALAAVAAELEGTDLNSLEAFAGSSPSAERVAEHIAGRLGEAVGEGRTVYRVTVTEAPGCCAAYYPHGP